MFNQKCTHGHASINTDRQECSEIPSDFGIAILDAISKNVVKYISIWNRIFGRNIQTCSEINFDFESQLSDAISKM